MSHQIMIPEGVVGAGAGGNLYVNSTGFQLPLPYANQTYTWYAYA